LSSIGQIETNGVTLGVEHFGDAAAPLVLLALPQLDQRSCERVARPRPMTRNAVDVID